MFRCHRVTSQGYGRITDKEKYTLSLLFALVLLLLSSSSKAEQLYLFDIKQQGADTALTQYGLITEQTIIFSAKLTEKIQANPVDGYYSKDHALNILLRGTGLAATFTEANQIKIAQQAFPSVTEQTASVAKPVTKKAPKPPQETIEKIAIIGSRKLSRSIEDLSVPVDILSNNMLVNTGQTQLSKMLQIVAPSFNVSNSSISDGTDVLKPATLRGLGPDQTLILINGKRRHHASLIHINTSVGRGTAGADLNTIPINAIKRIEILRDGAAAQYGSDAIAGVINIVLKDDTFQDNIFLSGGVRKKGDGETYDASINQTFSPSENAFVNFTINVQGHQKTDRSGLHGACQFDQCSLRDDGVFVTDDSREIQANRRTFEVGDPAFHQVSLAYNSQYQSDFGQWYSFATYSKRENESAAFFRHNANRHANPILSDGEASIIDGYLPCIATAITDHSFALGLRSTLFQDTELDISYSFGKNRIDYATKNSINASYATLLNEQSLTAEEIRATIPRRADAYGLSLSLQTFNLDIQRPFEYFNLAIGLEWRQDHYQVTAGDKYSYYNYLSDMPQAENSLAGIQGFPGISPDSTVNERRNVFSIYSEIQREFTDNLVANAAIRYDDYDGFGDTSNIKLAASWQMHPAVKLRGSISTGFRAPSMQQLYFNNTSNQFIVNDENQLNAERVGTFRNDSQLAQTIGIPELTEEKSTNLSFGTVINVNPQLSMTLDFYAIDIDDRIVISNKLSAEYSPLLAQALVAADIDKAQVFLNGADTQTRGIDFITSWQGNWLNGDLTLTLAGNYTDTEVNKLYSPRNSHLHLLTVDQVFAEQDKSIIEEWQPQNRISVTAQYQQDNWSLNLAVNHYGQYTITDGEKQTFGEELLTDIRFEQFINSHFSYFAGVNNLFDNMPDKNRIGNSNGGTIVDSQGNTIVSSPGIFKYSRRSAPFGFNGSYFYLGVNYQF